MKNRKIQKRLHKAFRRMLQLGTKQSMQRHYALVVAAMTLGIL